MHSRTNETQKWCSFSSFKALPVLCFNGSCKRGIFLLYFSQRTLALPPFVIFASFWNKFGTNIPVCFILEFLRNFLCLSNSFLSFFKFSSFFFALFFVFLGFYFLLISGFITSFLFSNIHLNIWYNISILDHLSAYIVNLTLFDNSQPLLELIMGIFECIYKVENIFCKHFEAMKLNRVLFWQL